MEIEKTETNGGDRYIGTKIRQRQIEETDTDGQ